MQFFFQGHLSGMMRVGWRTGSLLTVPPRWTKQTNMQGQKSQMESHCCPTRKMEGVRQLEGRWQAQDQTRLTPPAVVPWQTNSLSAAFKFPFQRRRALNSHHSVMGSLPLVLIMSLISCIPPKKKRKQAEQAEVIAFPSEDKSGRFAIVFAIDSRRG